MHPEVTPQEHARAPDGNAASSRPRPGCSRRRLSCPPTSVTPAAPPHKGGVPERGGRRATPPRRTSAAALNRKDLGGGTPRKHADRQTDSLRRVPPGSQGGSSQQHTGARPLLARAPLTPRALQRTVPRHRERPRSAPEAHAKLPSLTPSDTRTFSPPPPRSAFRSPSRGIQGKWRRRSSRLPATSAQVLPAHVSGTEGRARFTFSSLSRRRASKALRTHSFLLQTLLPRGRRARQGSGARGAHQGEGRGGRQTLFCLQRFAF